MLVSLEMQEFLKTEEVHRTVPCCQFWFQSQALLAFLLWEALSSRAFNCRAWASTSDCKVLLLMLKIRARCLKMRLNVSDQVLITWISAVYVILRENVRIERHVSCLLIWCGIDQGSSTVGACSHGVLWERALALKPGAVWRFNSTNRLEPAQWVLVMVWLKQQRAKYVLPSCRWWFSFVVRKILVCHLSTVWRYSE